MRMMFQAQPSADELAEMRGAVLQQVDANRDGKIELGEFARYDMIRYGNDVWTNFASSSKLGTVTNGLGARQANRPLF